MLRWLALIVLSFTSPAKAEPVVRGLDHIPVAVSELTTAIAHYEALGFVFKPGRAHANGIRNAHAKFPNGTEIELITAPAPEDALTEDYVTFLKGGDGAPFVGFYTPDMGELAARVSNLGSPMTLENGLATFPRPSLLHHLFFGRRQASPTDEARHFAHPNGATSLIGVWIAEDTLVQSLLQLLEAPKIEAKRCAPFGDSTSRMSLVEGEVAFVRNVTPRPILAATVAVKSLDAARRAIKSNIVAVPCAPDSLWVAPDEAHGIWLEFREVSR